MALARLRASTMVVSTRATWLPRRSAAPTAMVTTPSTIATMAVAMRDPADPGTPFTSAVVDAVIRPMTPPISCSAPEIHTITATRVTPPGRLTVPLLLAPAIRLVSSITLLT